MIILIGFLGLVIAFFHVKASLCLLGLYSAFAYFQSKTRSLDNDASHQHTCSLTASIALLDRNTEAIICHLNKHRTNDAGRDSVDESAAEWRALAEKHKQDSAMIETQRQDLAHQLQSLMHELQATRAGHENEKLTLLQEQQAIVEQLESQRKELEIQVESTGKELTLFRGKYTSVDKRRLSLDRLLNKKNAELDRIRSKANDCEEQLSTLAARLSQEKALYASESHELHSAREENKAFQARIQELEAECEEVKRIAAMEHLARQHTSPPPTTTSPPPPSTEQQQHEKQLQDVVEDDTPHAITRPVERKRSQRRKSYIPVRHEINPPAALLTSTSPRFPEQHVPSRNTKSQQLEALVMRQQSLLQLYQEQLKTLRLDSRSSHEESILQLQHQLQDFTGEASLGSASMLA